jgi:putative membrane protein
MPNYPIVSSIFIGIIALLHVYILVLEMFFWDKPAGRKAFGHSQEVASLSKVLAANQGLYNGFLVAGLFWGAVFRRIGQGYQSVFPLLYSGCRYLWRHHR